MPSTQNDSLHSEFLEFRQKYNKDTVTPKELEYRFKVFQSNLEKIKKHNKKKSTFTMGVNQFSDLTWEEFKNSYL